MRLDFEIRVTDPPYIKYLTCYAVAAGDTITFSDKDSEGKRHWAMTVKAQSSNWHETLIRFILDIKILGRRVFPHRNLLQMKVKQ